MTDVVDLARTGAQPGTRTPAHREAALLYLLARHLADHPDLPIVDVYPLVADDIRQNTLGLRCHLSSYDGHRAEALHAWATSLPGATITAEVVPSDWLDADVFVTAPLSPDATITIWAKVPYLSATLGLLDAGDPSVAVVAVDVDQLRHEPFAGRLTPDTGGADEDEVTGEA